MNYSRFIFTIFPAAASILVLAIWSDVHAQQPYSPPSAPASQLAQQANSTGNVPIVLRPLPGGSCPQGYHLVSSSVCIKDLPSSAASKTPPPGRTNTTNSFSIPSPSTTTTSQPNGTNPTNNNEENFGTKILKSFNQEFR
jgi:hypothetical protein